jgi:hypothetical protein
MGRSFRASCTSIILVISSPLSSFNIINIHTYITLSLQHMTQRLSVGPLPQHTQHTPKVGHPSMLFSPQCTGQVSCSTNNSLVYSLCCQESLRPPCNPVLAPHTPAIRLALMVARLVLLLLHCHHHLMIILLCCRQIRL